MLWKNQESQRLEKCQNFSNKSLGFIVRVLEKHIFFLPLFVISSVLLFQEDLFFVTIKISKSPIS